MIRVVLAEDQAMVLGALAALLETEPGLEVVGRVTNGEQALALVREHRPDVLVTDIEMPGATGLEVAAAIRRDAPRTRVVILTTFARPGYLRRALDARAAAYLLKDAPSDQLAEAIRRVHVGGRVIDPTHRRRRVPVRLTAGGRCVPGTAARGTAPVVAQLRGWLRTRGRPAAAGGIPISSVSLSLISHTNVGKMTLARTLLRRDVGEVRDAAHVTERSDAHILVSTPQGDELQLWDTPGFGDSARLLKRLRQAGSPLGWFLVQVWDRYVDRPFFSSQQAVRNVREDADVVLYLVNASEDPGAAGYVDAEMQILGWIGKPVIVLLNQLGPPRPAAVEAGEAAR